MKSTWSPTEFDQNKRDLTSIPGYVIKKNRSRGAKHGPSEIQKIYYQAKQMLEKARQGKHGCHPTILSRWYAYEEYRKSLSAIGWQEHHIMLYNRTPVEKHIYIATRAERVQNSKHRTLTINAEGGPQQFDVSKWTAPNSRQVAEDPSRRPTTGPEAELDRPWIPAKRQTLLENRDRGLHVP